jgi:flagellar basal-body rod modification protein FlgD
MTTTNGISSNGALAAYTRNPSGSKSTTDDIQDRFLALLVSQLRNQDPLNPMQNSEVTSQLAQINTVNGINKLNETVAKLMGQVDSGKTLQAAAIVGRQVMVPGTSLTLANGEGSGGFSLGAAADAVTVTIKDAAGVVLHRADLGKQAAGLHKFTWDGVTDGGQNAANGAYTFEIAATAGGKALTAESLALGRVDGVVPGTDGLMLNIAGMQATALAQVRQIF